ncbi:VOC family protein [Intrasporangium sp.]|uniref:VOC family protein n=1 Tax=Intrasporangium sp. TaxID=1925024 RepID=UPI00293A90FF|nr:VOC family protein [Intrasporangium sp.]MDV3221522.1 VOC family protein [Intrasporangium sp.]
MSTLDHLVVAAADLDEGARWVEDHLGVSLEAGGRHDAFGTHNRLLSLGPESYLEVISVDPAAPAPGRPRWFELDTVAMRDRLARGPALVHWVARVSSLAGEPDVLELRRGVNEWALTVAPDGRMPLGGLSPSRILWRTPPPSTTLPDKGIRLLELRLSSPDPGPLVKALAGFDGPVVVEPGPYRLTATLITPAGPVEIGSLR